MPRRFCEMKPRLFSRSGIAVGCVSEALEWKPDVFIQVGIGLHCEEAGILTGVWGMPKESVFGFDPHPRVHRVLGKLYPGELSRVAVSDVKGKATFYSKRHHIDGSSLYRHRNKDEVLDLVEVDTDTLDNLMLDKIPDGKSVLLWLDCEGNEQKALLGAQRILDKVDVINIEMTMKPPSDDWCDSVGVHNWITQRGFLSQWIHTSRVHSGQYDTVYVRKNLFNPLYCCCPYTIQEWRAWQAQKTT